MLDACIASWGKKSPFRKGTPADGTIGTGVKVFGIGSGQSGNDAATSKPALYLVRPAVNVAGKSTIRLNKLLAQPVVAKWQGGRLRGGASLTRFGERLIEIYDTMVGRAHEANADLLAEFARSAGTAASRSG